MTTLIRERKTVKPERHARLMQLGGNNPVLALTTGKETTFYHLETLPADFGKGFRLTKADQGDGPNEGYDINLDTHHGMHDCTCKGFLRWGMGKEGKGCRHIAALVALFDAGKLTGPASSPEPEQDEPAEAAEGKPATVHEPIPGREHEHLYGPMGDEDSYGFCAP